MPLYGVTKTFGHELGLSVCFRQHRAESHCHHLHGYALSVELKFAAQSLNEMNWVVDFGALAHVKDYLRKMFDHTLLVAKDDPHIEQLMQLHRTGVAQVYVVERVGCEAFAEMVAQEVSKWLRDTGYHPRVFLGAATVAEHGANSATYIGDPDVL